MAETRVRDDGFIEIIENGEVIGVQKPPRKYAAKRLHKKKGIEAKDVHQVVDSLGRTVFVPRGFNPESLTRTEWPYNEVTKDCILMLVTEGKTIREIAAMEGYPPVHTIYAWVRRHEDFKREFELAKKDRASYFHDKAIEVAMDVETKTDAITSKVKIDTLKWAAERGSPSEYGSKTVHEGNPDKPITFIIDTGIRRALPANEEKVVESDVQDE
jgi:transposase